MEGLSRIIHTFWNQKISSYTSVDISHLLKLVNIRIGKESLGIGRLSTIRKSDISDEIKCEFLQVVAVSVLLYGCTFWTLTICIKKKLDGNCTRMVQAIFSIS